MSEFPTLLKTAVTQVSVGNVSTEANIVLDEGAQRSFITKGLADELGTKPHAKEYISMSAFGSRKPTLGQLDVATVDIITDEGDKIPVRVLVVPTIATPLQNKHYRDISNLPQGAETSTPSVR